MDAVLPSVFHDPEIDGVTEQDLLGEYPAVKDRETARVPFEELTVTVVTPRMLYRMRKDTVRPLDRADAQALRLRVQLPEDA